MRILAKYRINITLGVYPDPNSIFENKKNRCWSVPRKKLDPDKIDILITLMFRIDQILKFGFAYLELQSRHNFKTGSDQNLPDPDPCFNRSVYLEDICTRSTGHCRTVHLHRKFQSYYIFIMFLNQNKFIVNSKVWLNQLEMYVFISLTDWNSLKSVIQIRSQMI